MKATGVPVPLPSLRDRARELSVYVDDVQAGYRHLDGRHSDVDDPPCIR